MSSIEDLSDTIKPKSDQLNADDLLTGPMNVLITGVRRGSAEQPVIIDIKGYMPFKPCKTMRRVLVTAWGQNGKDWEGRSMTLFCDPGIMYAGTAVGGIRISHLSHIDRPINMMLTISRGRKSKHIVHSLLNTKSEVTTFVVDDIARSWIDAGKKDIKILDQINDPEYKDFIAKAIM